VTACALQKGLCLTARAGKPKKSDHNVAKCSDLCLL